MSNDNIRHLPPRRRIEPIPVMPITHQTLQERIKAFLERPKAVSAEQQAADEDSKIDLMNRLAEEHALLCLKMAAIGGTNWAATLIESVARAARETATKYPS